MDFHPHEPLDTNGAQRYVWDSLKKAFGAEPGIAYHRYQIFARNRKRRREPDILLLHPALGIIVLECKGCRIGNVAAIQGAEWVMHDWHEECETPTEQAQDQMFAVESRYKERRETRGLLSFHSAVALPFVTRVEWQQKSFDRLTEGTVLLREDLFPGSIRETLERLVSSFPQKVLTDEQWQWALGVLRGQLPTPDRRNVPTTTPSESPIRIVRAIESRLKVLDVEQNAVAFAIPDGPQRIRGLAGTGKTVLFAQRAAKIHARYPDWRIAFVFFTKSLYEQVRNLVESSFVEMTGELPNWDKLNVLHAWGEKKRPGFYSTVARAAGLSPMSATEAGDRANSKSPGAGFEYACKMLESNSRGIPPLFDAVLIDEGQDLPSAFYRVALRALKEPKRLYWAYDEAQGIGSLLIPNAAMVFGEEEGKPIVDLSGKYEGGIDKSHVFRRCYRSPQLLLMVAHAANMGLLRTSGPLQGITTKAEWEDLGYVVEGDFRKPGSAIVLRRHSDCQRHPLDLDAELAGTAGSILSVKTFQNEVSEREWIADEVHLDLTQRGLQPTDLLITALVGNDEKAYLAALKAALENKGIKVWRAGEEDSIDFRREDHVTVTNIYRAKGNEAWKVYAARFHYATRPLTWKQETELHKRNEAFVALTRARLWCVVSGAEGPIFEELRQAIEQQPELRFAAFNRAHLKRILAEGNQEEAVAAET